MARKPRIEYEGAFYHVIVRGNQRQKIFKDKEDYLKYLELISNYKKRCQYYLHSYVLMSNHVHLLIETGKTTLSKIQQGINQSYTMYFNRKYGTVGHLFQGRYKAILCDRDAYLLSLIKYIHLNPVRAKMVNMPEQYKWSSHNSYIKKSDKECIVNTDQVLRIFSEDKTNAKKLYRAFMGDGIEVKKEDIYRTVDKRILGEEEFVEKVIDKCEVEVKKRQRHREYTLSEIAKGVEQTFGITIKQIRQKGKSPEISLGRKLVVLVASEYGYKGKEIAEHTKKDPAIITRHLKEKSTLKKEIAKVIRGLAKNIVNSQV